MSSANDNLDAPELAATCDGDTVVVTSNAIPDFTYVASSPGDPAAQDLTFKLPTMPTAASESGDIPMLGPLGVAVDGVPIYGPTEAARGRRAVAGGSVVGLRQPQRSDRLPLPPLWSADGVDCLYSAEEVTSGVLLLVGWAADGYPIMSGTVCADDACTSTKQLTSSWELSDDSLFATDTWDAHTYVEGSGDLDRCNGRTDTDGQYRYYTTETFPYIAGCFHGEVANDAIPSLGGGAGGAGGPGGNAGPPPGQ
nr:YHYH protein [Candidatus Microthrix sp.]